MIPVWLLAAAVASQPVELFVGGTTVVAEVADTPVARRVGLMGRASLAPDTGMLFVFPQESERSFWMKNTPLPLSIAYMDAKGRIVHMADMTPLSTDPVPSKLPALYALEMTQGWFKEHGVMVGQTVGGIPGPASQ
ncbi:MAG: DUF192 domain-containing protein [Myxococcota bacterium]